jgi:hypothetical protein
MALDKISREKLQGKQRVVRSSCECFCSLTELLKSTDKNLSLLDMVDLLPPELLYRKLPVWKDLHLFRHFWEVILIK